MFFKFAAVAVLYIAISSFLLPIDGCKLYCLVCPNNRLNPTKREYYCCMQNWQKVPIVRDCGNNTVVPATTTTPTTLGPTTVALPTTPCPTLQPPSRCPKSEKLSDKECENYRRFYPNPKKCVSDSDCSTPFNVCCEDECFNLTKICKTYKTEFEP